MRNHVVSSYINLSLYLNHSSNPHTSINHHILSTYHIIRHLIIIDILVLSITHSSLPNCYGFITSHCIIDFIVITLDCSFIIHVDVRFHLISCTNRILFAIHHYHHHYCSSNLTSIIYSSSHVQSWTLLHFSIITNLLLSFYFIPSSLPLFHPWIPLISSSSQMISKMQLYIVSAMSPLSSVLSLPLILCGGSDLYFWWSIPKIISRSTWSINLNMTIMFVCSSIFLVNAIGHGRSWSTHHSIPTYFILYITSVQPPYIHMSTLIHSPFLGQYVNIAYSGHLHIHYMSLNVVNIGSFAIDSCSTFISHIFHINTY